MANQDHQALLKAKLSTAVGSCSITHTEKHNKTCDLDLWTMTLKFSRVLEVVKVHVRAKLHQAKCSGSWVINSALDFGQLYTLIASISGTDQAIDKRKTALSSTIFFHIWWKQFVELWSTSENMTLIFDRWPWHCLDSERLSRYMLMQNFIKLPAAVHELSCYQRKTNSIIYTCHMRYATSEMI